MCPILVGLLRAQSPELRSGACQRIGVGDRPRRALLACRVAACHPRVTRHPHALSRVSLQGRSAARAWSVVGGHSSDGRTGATAAEVGPCPCRPTRPDTPPGHSGHAAGHASARGRVATDTTSHHTDRETRQRGRPAAADAWKGIPTSAAAVAPAGRTG